MAKTLRSFDHFALLGVGRVCAPFVDRGSRLAAAEEKFAATRLHGPVMRRVHPGVHVLQTEATANRGRSRPFAGNLAVWVTITHLLRA